MSQARRPRVAALPILFAFLAALVAAACSGGASATPATPSAPVTVTGFDGTDVVIEARPERIVSLTPAATETLFKIGAGDRIVGRSEDPNPFPAEAAAVPALTNMMAVDVEKVVALEPDLVVAGGLGFTSDDSITHLRNAGIPVLVLYAADVAGVMDDIRTIGKASGDAEAANTLADGMRSDIDAVSAAAAAGATTRSRVFYEIDASGDIYGPADKSFIAEMVNLAGGDAITTGSPDVYSIPLERLIQANPEVILLGDAAYGVTPEAVAARTGWGTMDAVVSGAVRPVDDVVITRPGPRLGEGLRALATAINPGVTLP